MARSKPALFSLVFALVLGSCSADGQAQSTTSSEVATTVSLPPATTTLPTTTTAPSTTTTVEIVSPLPPPTGAVIATGEGWELTDQEFSDLVDFAAESMQQSYPDPVGVEVLGLNGVTELSEPGLEYITPLQWDILRALGLVTKDELPLDEVNELRRQRVRGTCCIPAEEGLTVQVEDAGSEELTKVVIVHELVHALLTQRPPQGVVPDQAFDEPVDVVTAAAEGVPQWVALRYHASLTDVERRGMADELPIIRDVEREAGVSQAAAELLTFGYTRGPALVDGIGAVGVSRPYDQVVDRFPATSEQVLFPDSYLAEELPVTVLSPVVPGVAAQASGRFGSSFLLMLVETVVDEETSLPLVRPWVGDSYIQWTEGDRACVAINLVMDNEASPLVLANVLQTWAAARPDATADASGTSIQIRSCS